MGASMVPQISQGGDVILFERVTHRLEGLKRGEVVVAMSARDPGAMVCKRVGGIAGDRCLLADKTEIVVPKGHVFLVGDNQPVSHDSRHYGPVSQGLVLGKVCKGITEGHRSASHSKNLQNTT
eukprot:6420854-Amphidinium_carterae.1